MIRRLILWAFLIGVGLPLGAVLLFGAVPVPITPLMLIRASEGHDIDKTWVPMSRISAYLPEAVVAAEDNLFCRHGGFDWRVIGEQLETTLAGGRSRGASTISMQVAKNLFLWPDRNWARKGLEAYLTIYIETLWSKRRIIEVYLNIAEWGPGLYGAEAAANRYFGKSANELSRREAALMAAILPNPREWKISPPSDYVASRSNTLVRRIGEIGPLLDCLR